MDANINDVSDTALWVAHYRALETQRKDALFRDPLAAKLIGDRGKAIAESMKESSPYTQWTVIIRTCIIDQFLQELIANGIDTVLNLGAGMDTRPYRMQLPKNLQWIEVDYANIIDHKNNLLANEVPNCKLERISVDLADNQKRKNFFTNVSMRSQKVAILTEGLIPYLTEEQMGQLADDLFAQKSFLYWIGEYLSPLVYDSIKTKTKVAKMKKAPFVFFPKDWFGFFASHGWIAKDIRYMPAEGHKLNRRFPAPWWGVFMYLISSKKRKSAFKKMSAFVLYTKKS
jgi:methyltransferase (TIGR00027 family)